MSNDHNIQIGDLLSITIEDNSEHIDQEFTNYAEGSIQDPEMQKLTGK